MNVHGVKKISVEKRKAQLKATNAYARLLGEYTGMLKGIILWDIPKKLREKINKKIAELENIKL